MTDDTYDQAVALKEKIAQYETILANAGNLFPNNLGEHFDAAQEINGVVFNALKETMNTNFRTEVQRQRDLVQAEFDELQGE